MLTVSLFITANRISNINNHYFFKKNNHYFTILWNKHTMEYSAAMKKEVGFICITT